MSPFVETRGPFTLSTDAARLPLDDIHRWLADESYWARGIPRDVFVRSLEHALSFAIYEGDRLVAYARVITDYATIAYLGDVFVREPWRGRGLATWLVEAIHRHPDLQGLRRWILLTRDAHGVYARAGWTPLEDPARWMELRPRREY
jgi:GNAT superfamily N-acetyltransferase